MKKEGLKEKGKVPMRYKKYEDNFHKKAKLKINLTLVRSNNFSFVTENRNFIYLRRDFLEISRFNSSIISLILPNSQAFLNDRGNLGTVKSALNFVLSCSNFDFALKNNCRQWSFFLSNISCNSSYSTLKTSRIK